VLRHQVIPSERVLTVRVDESLYLANTPYLEDRIYDLVAARSQLEHVPGRQLHRRERAREAWRRRLMAFSIRAAGRRGRQAHMTPLGHPIELTVPCRDGGSICLPMADDDEASFP
jgi:hypothetical protein